MPIFVFDPTISTSDNDSLELRFTKLHLAAIEGTDITALLDEDPELLHVQDKLGMTACHYAALYGHFEILKQLVNAGASLLIYSFSDKLPIDFAEDGKIARYLIGHGSFDKGSCPFHLYAYLGMQSELKQYLEQNPDNVNISDFFGNTAIHYAIKGKQRETFHWLIQQGADPKKSYEDSTYSGDSVGLAEYHSQYDCDASFPWNHFIKEIKQNCSLGKENLDKIRSSIKNLFTLSFNQACINGKKLLFVIGEYHGYYPIYEIEKIILDISKQIGFNALHVEKHPESEYDPSSCWLDHYAKNKLEMAVHQIDVAGSNIDNGSQVDERNIAMTEEIIKHNCAAVVVVGSAHLKGLLEIPHSHAVRNDFYNRFFVVPITLSAIFDKHNPFLTDKLSPEEHFFVDSQNAIQVKEDNTLTDPTSVISKWNSIDNNPRLPKKARFPQQRPHLLPPEDLFLQSNGDGMFTCFRHWFRSWFENPPLTSSTQPSNAVSVMMGRPNAKRSDK